MFLVYVYFKVLLYLQKHFGREYAAVQKLHFTNTVAPHYIAYIERYGGKKNMLKPGVLRKITYK